MSIKDTIQNALGNDDDDDEPERLDIDKITGEELQNSIDYLEAIGRETKRADIEEAAYYLRNVDDSAELYSAFETGEERGRVDKSIVAPSNMERETKWHTRDGDFYQILTTTSLPRLVSPGWLVPITLSEHDVRLSMHIKPRDTASVKGRLQQRLTQMKSAIQWKRQRGRTDVYEEEHERQELERLLRNVIEGTTKLFNFGFYMEIHGDTLEEMEEASRSVQRKVSEQGMDMVPVEGRQIESQQAILPVGADPILNNNTVQLEALATFFNFVEPPVVQPTGVILGFDDSKRPVIVDRFELSGHSKVVTGKVGGGKTYATKMAIYRRHLIDNNVRTIIFDPLGDDFVDFTRKAEGTVIKFGGEDRINPLQIEPPTGEESATDLYTTKVRSVIEILKTYFDQSSRTGMGAGEEGVITQAAHYAYAKKGITADPATFGNESPILDDVIEGVRVIAENGIESESSPVNAAMADGAGTLADCPPRTREIIEAPSEEHVRIAQSLVPKFESFKEGSVNNNLNGNTNIELDDDLICFDMESFADTGEMPLIMHTMLDWAYQEARRSPKRTDVTFEEAHYLLGRSGARKLLNLFIRHARHFDAGLTLISQTPDEFLGNDEKKEIYDNCDIKQLFYQENVSSEVIQYFDFSDEEVRFLRQAARGQNSGYSECLLSTSEHGRRRLEVHTGPYGRHMLEEDLDPHGYLRQQGLKTEKSEVKEGGLNNSISTDEVTEAEANQWDDVQSIDDPKDLNHQTYSAEEDAEAETPASQKPVRAPFRVKGPEQPDLPTEIEEDPADSQIGEEVPQEPIADLEAKTDTPFDSEPNESHFEEDDVDWEGLETEDESQTESGKGLISRLFPSLLQMGPDEETEDRSEPDANEKSPFSKLLDRLQDTGGNNSNEDDNDTEI